MSPLIFPAEVSKYLARVGLSETDVCVLSFDEAWALEGSHGELARFGLAELDGEQLGTLFQEICLGLSRVRGAELKQVSLPNGSAVDLYLFSAPDCVHVMLLDVQAEMDEAREWQQSAQETKLRSYEKSRELRSNRARIDNLRQEFDALKVTYTLFRTTVAVLAGEFGALAGQTGEHALAVASSLAAVLPFKAPQSGADLDLSTLVARLRQVTGINVLVSGRNSETPTLSEPEIRATLLAALQQAKLRATGAAIKATLIWDGTSLLFSVFDGGADFTTAQRLALWEGQLPKDECDELTAHLLVLGARLRAACGRVTARWTAERGMQLTLSVRNVLPPVYERTRALPPVGSGFWLLTAAENWRQAGSHALEAAGFGVELHAEVDALLERAVLDPPIAVFVDPTLQQGAGAKFAFQLRAQGFTGRIVSLGEFKGGPALRAAFNSELRWPVTDEQLRAALAE